MLHLCVCVEINARVYNVCTWESTYVEARQPQMSFLKLCPLISWDGVSHWPVATGQQAPVYLPSYGVVNTYYHIWNFECEFWVLNKVSMLSGQAPYQLNHLPNTRYYISHENHPKRMWRWEGESIEGVSGRVTWSRGKIKICWIYVWKCQKKIVKVTLEINHPWQWLSCQCCSRTILCASKHIN